MPRNAKPALRMIRARARLRSSPSRRASQGANGANKTRHSTGKVVSIDRVSTENCPSLAMRGNRGASDASPGRKLSPTKIINTIKVSWVGFLRLWVMGSIGGYELLYTNLKLNKVLKYKCLTS